MNSSNQKVDYKIKILQDQYYVEDRLIFLYRIEYIVFNENIPGFIVLNNRNQREAMTKQAYAVDTLYTRAVHDDLHGEPNLPYQYTVNTHVTYNTNNTFSGYQDEYIYVGGFKGSTTRTAYTYDTRNGQSKSICDYMKSPGCLTCISNNIINQIKNGGETSQYLPNYEQLVPQTFQVADYYVTPEGVIIFFDVDEIAPYAEGIKTFLIPFNTC